MERRIAGSGAARHPDNRGVAAWPVAGRGVVVNFGDTDHTLPDGTIVKRRDYTRFRATPTGLVHTPPPCSNVFAE